MKKRNLFAQSQTKFFRFFADTFFRKKYGQRALVLETVAGVPGMIGGMLTHLKSLRRLQRGNGHKIHELLAEAENERKHLMFFMEIVHPTALERFIIIVAQMVFWHYYLLLYLISPRTAHLTIAYFEEEAVRSYTDYLAEIEAGNIENVDAPEIAKEYYNMLPDAKLSDMIKYIREDERGHSQANLRYANESS